MEYDARLVFRRCENSSEDMKRIFDWSNDEDVRKNSFSCKKISLQDHKKWFENKMNDANYHILFYVEEEKYIGLVRLAIVGENAIISYLISKDYRGKGYGKSMIKKLEQYVKENNLAKHLIAEVKHSNVASQRIFEKLGYIKVTEEDMISYIKNEL